MVDLDRHSCRGFKQIPRGQQLDFGALKQTGGEKRFRLQKLTPFDFFPKDIRALGDQQIGGDQFCFLPEYQRLRRTVLLDHPLDGDAGIDDERVHRSSRPSRSRTSEGVCFRRFVSLRRSAANVSKEGSTSPLRAWWRISRCSASVERPCRAARRFNRAIRSSSKLRTCRFPAIGRSMRSLISMISYRAILV